MLEQLKKILQEKYPKLEFKIGQRGITITYNTLWILTLYDDEIYHYPYEETNHTGFDIKSITINDPDYLEEIDRLIIRITPNGQRISNNTTE